MFPNASLGQTIVATPTVLGMPRARLQEMPDTRQGEIGGAPELLTRTCVLEAVTRGVCAPLSLIHEAL
jgi:hypothetical protein